MAQTQQLPTLDFSENYWVDLEVPYGLIERDWDSQYRDEFDRHVEKYRISKDLLKTYWTLIDGNNFEDLHYKLEDIVSDIEDHEVNWLKNVLCVFMFSQGKNPDFVDSVFDSIESEINTDDFEDIYDEVSSSGTKNAKVGMIQVFQPNRLKDILGLQACYRPKPQLVTESKEGLDNIDELDIDKVVDYLEKQTANEYEHWYKFEHEGQFYFLIKRDLTDAVERQVEENLQEEPAEFLVLVFDDQELHIYSEQSSRASTALNGVNQAIRSQYEKELEEDEVIGENTDANELENRRFESPDVGVDYDQFEAAIENTRTTAENTDLILKAIAVDGADLPNNPNIELETEQGLGETLDWFEERDVNLLEQPDDVKRVTFRYSGRDWTLIPKETDNKWVFQYEVKLPEEDDQIEFENKIREHMEVDILFQKS
ncbi:hypothetical protein [Halorubrum sp. DTA98]|uniref:hypothetical protein n=1 Tax=Halorubrum sp. DTA98 TaxID=3402163 RepID=UPI003AB08E62